MFKRAVIFLAVLMVGCEAQQATIGQNPDDTKQTDSVKDDLILGTRVHQLPMHAPSPQNNATPALSTNMLKYYGGKVIPNAKIYTVNWGGSVNSQVQAKMPAFYQAVMNSNYVDWLSEYNTVGLNGQDGQPGSNQSIGRGSSGGSFTINPSITSSTVDDTQIQSEISAQINSGVLPQPTDNTLYAINFPKTVTITQGGSSSCSEFCAYHGTFTKGTQDVYYSVLPSVETGTACASGCGSNASWLDNETEVASHEMVEAITDAEVGIGTTVGRPLAWYNTSQGEIGDICNGTSATFVGGDGVTYTVQKEYDNATGNCISSKGTGGGAGGGAGGGGGTGGGTGGGSGGGGGTVSDFAIAMNPTTASISAGSSVSFTVTTSVIAGSAQTVSLSVSGLPSGASGSFSPASVSSGGSSTLTVTTSTSTPVGTSTVTVKGTASTGSHTTTASLSVTSATGGETVLSNGVAVSASGAKSAQAFYRIDVPSGASNLVIAISGGTGDADLYTKFGSRPSLTSYDCRPYINGNSEQCSVPAPSAGSYYIMLNGYAAYSGVSLVASFTAGGGTGGGAGGGGTGGGGGSGGDPALSNGVAVGPLSGAKTSSTYFQISVPAGTTQLVVTTTGSTSTSNDADLYVKQSSHPTASSYNCRSWNYGSNEQCTIDNPAAGTWYVMIRGYTAYSGVTLEADWN